jgi:hypothetical protein
MLQFFKNSPGWLCFDFEVVSCSTASHTLQQGIQYSYNFVTRYSLLPHFSIMNIDNSCPLARHWLTNVAVGNLQIWSAQSYSVHPTTDTFYM